MACPSSLSQYKEVLVTSFRVIRPKRSQSVPRGNLFELKSRDIEIIRVIVQKIAFYKQSSEHICCCVYLIEANT